LRNYSHDNLFRPSKENLMNFVLQHKQACKPYNFNANKSIQRLSSKEFLPLDKNHSQTSLLGSPQKHSLTNSSS